MSEQQYTSPLVQVIWNKLYPEVERAVKEAGGIPAMMWKAFRPEVPKWLEMLDKDVEAQGKILEMVQEFIGLVEEAGDKHGEESR